MTRFMNEHQGCKGNIVDMDSFNDFIRDLSLIDIPLGRRSFTWSNKHAMLAFVKLDRLLISDTWDDAFPLSTCKAIPNTLSGHIPMSLHTSSNLRCANRFYLESMWLDHHHIHDIMASAWSSISHTNTTTSLTLKLC